MGRSASVARIEVMYTGGYKEAATSTLFYNKTLQFSFLYTVLKRKNDSTLFINAANLAPEYSNSIGEKICKHHSRDSNPQPCLWESNRRDTRYHCAKVIAI